MQDIKTELKKVILDTYDLDFDPEITPSPSNINADYSSNVPLKLAKSLHKSPMEIAKEIEVRFGSFVSVRDNGSDLASEPRNGGRERSGEQNCQINLSSPGFLNFTLPDDYLKNQIDELSDDFGKKTASNEFTGKTVICEFSDPNPFKVLHIGHLYTSIVGDSISRLFEYASANVIRANFGGDVGLHVAKTMYVLEQRNNDNLQIEDIAKCYIEGTAAYEDDEQARAKITELNKEIYHINSDKIHDTPLADLYWQGRELSYDYFRDFYDQIGVKFDKYYPESTVAALGLAKVQEQLKNGVYEMSDGAVIFDGKKYGLHTRVFINQEGVPTYETKDVGLIFTKWQDYHFDRSIVITGGEQKDYMQVVLKSIEQYAPELTERTTHLTHGLVKLAGGVKMSSRKGNFLKAVDVLDMVRTELTNEYNSEDETIVLAAIKYAFLKYKMGGNIIFDPKESVKMTGNSGPYLLYSAVRAKRIIVNHHNQDSHQGRDTHDKYTYNTHERNLSKAILEYKGALQESVHEMAPHKIANYLYELAQIFSRFYEHCPVVGTPEESERIKLVQAYLNVITHGLSILGINIPEEM